MSTQSRISIRLTRLGFHCAFLGGFAVFGGAARGFNLLLVLAALLIGALLIHWRWSRHNIASIAVGRRLPREVFVGQRFSVRFQLANRNRFLMAWMIRLEDLIESITGQDQATAGCGIASVRAGGSESADYNCLFARRGRYRFGPMHLESTFPFALFRCCKTINEYDEICILPELLELAQRWEHGIVGNRDGISTNARRTGSTNGELFGLREWQNGDSPKWIHWRTTARLMTPAVRQFEQQRRFDLCIIVDAYAADESDEPLAETAISLAATIVTKLLSSRSGRIVLGTAGSNHNVAVGIGSDSDQYQMLVLLADVKISQNPRIAAAVGQVIPLAGSTTDLIVISSRSESDAFTNTDGTLHLRRQIAPLANVRWINVGDKDLTDLVVARST